jgi:hypothetical protein
MSTRYQMRLPKSSYKAILAPKEQSVSYWFSDESNYITHSYCNNPTLHALYNIRQYINLIFLSFGTVILWKYKHCTSYRNSKSTEKLTFTFNPFESKSVLLHAEYKV